MTANEQPTPEVLTELTQRDVEDVTRLLGQLSSKQRDEAEVALNMHGVLSSPNSRTVVVRDENGRIQATATGNLCPIPTGNKAWVDDVVTDSMSRGKGYGWMVTEALHDWFVENGILSANLTSLPSRDTAGALYERMGYEQRETRVYRVQLSAGAAAVGPA